MSLKKLPIGYSSLTEVINRDCVYVDKTKFVARLVEQGKYYFLSRPRRFGKSLLVDTLRQAFIGNKAVFQDLYLENHWDWSVQYPVIRFGFSGSSEHKSEKILNDIVINILKQHIEKYQIEIDFQHEHGEMLTNLIVALFNKYHRQVVVLIDEYDKPILDVIDDSELAKKNRSILKSLYGCLKELDAYIKLVFITGVSKFSKVSLFSGLNNLEDITLNPNYADLCGYTQAEVDHIFEPYLLGVDKEKLKEWYNGYNFDGSEEQKVYNPFDILLFISNNKQYKSYWFETGTPAFLIKVLQKNQYYVPNFEQLSLPETDLGGIDVDAIPLAALAFQTGYLTIKGKMNDVGGGLWYQLSYPNQEVKRSFNQQIAALGVAKETCSSNILSMYAALSAVNFDQFKSVIQSLFSSIPCDWYRNNDIQHYEGFYCSVVYSYFCAAGYEVVGEDVTNKGRVDLTIKAPNAIFIFEFKIKVAADSAVNALAQIKQKKYAAKYVALSRPIYLIGMVFDAAERNLVDFLWDEFAG